MNEPLSPQPATSGKKLLIGAGAAVVVAGVALVGFVLPAEYGIDPTGIGKALGVTKLAEGEGENIYLARGKKRTDVLLPLDGTATLDEATLRATIAGKPATLPEGAPLKTDRYTVELLPFEGVEMKYELAQGTPMLFRWAAPVPIHVDMHAHPYEGGEELTESYVIEDATPGQTAVYVAPFTGIHGWYWENRTLDPITVTIDATGAMTRSFTFDKAGQHPREFTPPAASGGAASGPPAPAAEASGASEAAAE